MTFRRLGEPFVSVGAYPNLGKTRPVQKASFELGALTPNPTGFDLTGGAGAANLAATEAAALQGRYGLAVNIPNVNARYGELSGPAGETRIETGFLLDPNSLTMAAGDWFRILNAVSPGLGLIAVFLSLRFLAGNYEIRLTTADDAGAGATINVTIPDRVVDVKLVWRASDGSNNGYSYLYIDGLPALQQTGIDNDTHNVTALQYGAVAGIDAGTLGVFFMDEIYWGRPRGA